ncbi:hypothetical protein F441_01057 [Phytophthora nicotianae CJ01A1]|uniref:Isopentenyl-diphosphate delta-isomerase n=4 Tax=Phytophthora nicotianae TaxID=4792 RepID=V9FXW5_PHYNI|nr:hypothetical protein F443_01084 [Phytophthora nicotianae P1569]ETK96161.1 hypothetical protein L915_01024 [Phytophthora nicotianae]ETP26171.1 hypothetical protein F441_01057 [Phytophthora nicotianae CJ01A1]ETP54169.1 hypothetical protein F442_01030 [Phytophthora nicotianae P10297]ETL49538.1 hypothetical protein L916_01008 [Phytophthora nicotianae]
MGRGEYYRNKYGGGRGGGRGGRGGRGRGRGDSEGFDRGHSGHYNDRPRTPLTTASWERLGYVLQEIHNRNYGAYHELERVFEFQSNDLHFALEFDHIQGDPYASPSRSHVTVSATSAAFPAEMYQDKIRNVALCDYLTRVFAASARSCGADVKTTSNSWQGVKGGDISIDTPGQHVIERSSVNVLANGDVETRFNINLPARGRSICGDWAYTILVETLPKLVEQSLVLKSLDKNHIWQHLHSVGDQEALRGMLKDAGLVGFVRDGAVLPRQSGASDLPLSSDKAIPFKSPKSLSRTFTLPNYGVITGMGIPQGVTLFVGGGFHGKSTVLKALEVGVYNHVPSDGREFVVMDPNAAKIRSEDSRSVVCTDISAFIDNLPFKQDTTRFSTADASGSTSQAANIIEALEVGATTLLIDEDTCATNFMIRDWKMQQLVAKDKEPITPFISKVQALYKQRGVSSVLVIGGAGDYFSVADHVIMMDSYEPRDVTTEAKKIASEHGEIRQDAEFGEFNPRIPLGRGFEVNGKVVSRGLGKIQYGEVDLDLSAVEQIVEPSQVRTIADAIQKTRSFMDGKCTLEEVLIKLEGEMDRTGSLDVVGFHKKSGFYTRPRKLELAAAINRLRTATMTQ